MSMPRFNRADAASSSPITRGTLTPYAQHWRLFRTPNDAFLTAQYASREACSLYDILQPVYAALYSGAIHPTAEGHAIVADQVMRACMRGWSLEPARRCPPPRE